MKRMKKDAISEMRKRSLRCLVVEAAVYAAVLTVIFSFMLGITVQTGNSMSPVINDGDIVIFFRKVTPCRGEAVIYEAEQSRRIGRIAAAAGSLISTTGDGQLTIDGRFIPADPSAGIYGKTTAVPGGTELPLTVTADSCFILNDNRSAEEDSRIFGAVNERDIKGYVIAVLRVSRI